MSTIIQSLSPNELSHYVATAIKEQFINLLQELSVRKTSTDDRPHLTRKETAKFFDVTTNCINDWVKKGLLTPMKMGQRTYFSKAECIEVMFNQLKTK